MLDAGAVATGPAQLDPDGNDDPEDPGTGTVPARGHFEKVGTPPLALTRICDLTPFDGALYMAHAHQPLGIDGATITRYRPNDDKKPFSIAFDWNRPGEPVKGGGAGQGFVRIRTIGGRMYVPDADPPYGGLGLADWGTEGYVFVSDDKGVFLPPRAPHYRPPASVAVLPRAYHVIDVIRFRGTLYASTGSVPPTERAWHGASPGALHRGPSFEGSNAVDAGGVRWTYETDYPYPWGDGVWRLTFMVRFKDRLYAGIQDFDGRDPNDFVYFAPTKGDAGATVIKHEDAHPVRVTKTGGSGTLRWWVDTKASPAKLYWLAWTREGIVLRSTTDGDDWSVVPLPPEAGRPTDVTRFRDAVVVLAEKGLYKLGSDGTATRIAEVEETGTKKKSTIFTVGDFFCTAPLAVLDNVLYAGSQKGGTLYKLVED